MTRASLLRISLVWGYLLAGCAPVQAIPLPNLPPPRVGVTHAAPTLTTPRVPAEPAPLFPTGTPASPLQTLAEQAYGSRLVQQIDIPEINVSSQVVAVGWQVARQAGLQAGGAEWDSPGSSVGWLVSSALPDQAGNVILYGHNNMNGSVFKYLGKLTSGDEISLLTGGGLWKYRVDQVLILPVLNVDAETRRAYQEYLQPTPVPRLTIISCWPPVSNTDRVIVLAYPLQIP